MISLTKYAKENKLKKDTLIKKLTEIKLIIDEKTLTEKGSKSGISISNYMGNSYFQVKDKKVFDDIFTSSKNALEILKNNFVKKEREKDTIRTKFKAEYRTTDWHFVRSRAEMIIDDWLYNNWIVHAYEKKLPVEEELYSDFYIPEKKVYLEFWGMEENTKYKERKIKKIEIYKKYNINIIELDNWDLENLDDILPKKLLKYGITVF